MYQLSPEDSSEDELSQLVHEARQRRRKLDENGQLHCPNHIPLNLRQKYLFQAIVLAAYAGYGLYVDDIFIPGKRGAGVHFQGVAAYLLGAAMMAAVLNMSSIVIDHYDRRDNEYNYKMFARLTFVLGWVLLIFAFAAYIYIPVQ
jgi:hypothetical protein